MSDLLKARSTPQFIWYNKWTSLGPNGLPHQAIKDSLKQLNCIKISFTVNTKELTRSGTHDQACFGPILVQMLHDLKVKIILRLPANKQCN